MHGYVKDSNGTRIFIKDCERHQTFFQTVGCVRVKNEFEGQAIDDHLCFCDTNDCNKEYCHPEDCSCAYADPDSCPPEPVDPTSKYTLFRNKRFMIDEMTQQNASKFAIGISYIRKPKVASSIFHFMLFYFFPSEFPGLCRHIPGHSLGKNIK